jgi:hypothetical protein
MAAGPRQKGNLTNASVPASSVIVEGDAAPPPLTLPNADASSAQPSPVKQLNGQVLRNLGAQYRALFDRYASERISAEQKWLKNLRQYLGIYDPDVERLLPPNRSRAYPRLTRVKCISMLSRLMNLMFPGNETNWELKASPSPEMSPEDVADAVSELMTKLQADGQQVELTQELVDEAVRRLADKVAAQHSNIIEDQLLELGGDQTRDWIGLNRQIVDSGIKYGVGVLEGPYVRKITTSGWMMKGEGTKDAEGNPVPGGFEPVKRTTYKPQFNFLPIWDFYPDMSARTLPGEGYFVRKVLGRSALRKLADRKDFFKTQVKAVLNTLPGGNFRAKSWETELRTMGLAVNAQGEASAAASGREKYEIIIWKGPVSANTLLEAGAEVPEHLRTDDVEAELWMIDTWIIKAEINAWRSLDIEMTQAHIFQFDEDDTSPVGQGLPAIVRDSQLSICAATRMTLDNASVICGPNLEVNTTLLRADQDLSAVLPYKLWYRDDDGPSAQFPAVRPIAIDGHLNELQGLVRMFVDFAEMETFIGPGTGGDMTKVPSEPMRTAAGASMLRGDAALPFKDIVRNYDSFTQSVIWSMVGFNKKFNPDLAPEGDIDVIPRGATSLIAKEVRGAQIDQLSQTLTPEERDHLDERKFLEAKMAARDMQGMLVSVDEANRIKSGRAEEAAKASQQQSELIAAEIKKTLSDAFKGVAQAQKNTAGAQGQSVKTSLDMIEAGQQTDEQGTDNGSSQAAA